MQVINMIPNDVILDLLEVLQIEVWYFYCALGVAKFMMKDAEFVFWATSD